MHCRPLTSLATKPIPHMLHKEEQCANLCETPEQQQPDRSPILRCTHPRLAGLKTTTQFSSMSMLCAKIARPSQEAEHNPGLNLSTVRVLPAGMVTTCLAIGQKATTECSSRNSDAMQEPWQFIDRDCELSGKYGALRGRLATRTAANLDLRMAAD